MSFGTTDGLSFLGGGRPDDTSAQEKSMPSTELADVRYRERETKKGKRKRERACETQRDGV